MAKKVEKEKVEDKKKSKSLVIVESPAKAKTINKYLGNNYLVKASVGHVKDLPVSKLGIDLENNFTPQYEVIKGKGTFMKEIKKLGRDARNVYLATDPDREGEVIAWHISNEILGENGSKKDDINIFRVQFNEITPKAVQDGIANPQAIDMNKVNAQQARRVLDRIVGYKISPLLWQKIKRGLSAGRVQSVAVRIIVEREKEITEFVTREYWTIEAVLNKNGVEITAKLKKKDGQEIEIGTQADADAVIQELEGQTYEVVSVEQKEKKRNPTPPFITSKLQQEASRKLGFSPKKTMMIAQQLYEGLDLGKEGHVGLITYMRTDSTRLSADAVKDGRNLIKNMFGQEYLPDKAVVYKTKKSAQDAHEAIRPTYPDKTPESVRDHLESDQYKLYKLIWNKFISSQMKPALYDTMAVGIKAGRYLFNATGSLLKFDGFMKVYLEEKDTPDKEDDDHSLPALIRGDILALTRLDPEQHFTQPPPRFSEASLIKVMEEEGIGRPSTYASTISTIQSREYVELREGRFYPTELGTLVNDMLVQHFPDIIDVKFTANMEEGLDSIEEGNEEWVHLIDGFYSGFKTTLDKASAKMKNLKKEETPTDIKCDKCNSMMVIKWGKNGKFLACSAYPECKNTKEIQLAEGGEVKIVKTEEITTTEVCEKCGKNMMVKTGRFGKFLACSGYPECKSTKNITVTTGIQCPSPGCKGELCEKKSKKGKTFYSCTKYPDCKFAMWDKPKAEPCPVCKAPFMVEKSSKKDETPKLVCINPDCENK